MIQTMRYFIFFSFWLVSTAALALPQGNSSVISPSELMRVIMGLFFILLIIVLLSWLVKRLHGVHLSTSNGFQSIASMTLGPKEKIMLMKVGAHYLLMGVGGGAVTLLCDFGNQLPEGFDTDNKQTFAQLFKSALGKP